MDENQLADCLVIIASLATIAYIAWSFRLMKQQATSVVVVVNCIFFAVYILPVLLDFLIGDPDYGHLVGYNDATENGIARIYSSFALFLAPIIWTELAIAGLRERKPKSTTIPKQVSAVRPTGFLPRHIALIALAVTPLLLLPLAPRLDVYASYGPILAKVGRRELDELSFHAYLNQSVFYSMLSCFALLIGTLRSKTYYRYLGILAIVALLTTDCYLHGKRASVALALCSIVFCVWYTNAIRRQLLVPLLVASILIAGGFSHWYQVTFGRTQANTFEELYDSFRLEFSRDHAHKFVMYRTLIATGQTKILGFYGESILIYATLPIPRSVWPEKPISYAMSLTCAALGDERHYLGWSVTSSIFDEAIANFGFLGVLIGPVLFGVILRCSIKQNRAVFRMVTTVLCLMLMMVHLSSCLPMLLGWLLALWQSSSTKVSVKWGLQ